MSHQDASFLDLLKNKVEGLAVARYDGYATEVEIPSKVEVTIGSETKILEVKNKLVAILDADKNLLIIDNIQPSYGEGKGNCNFIIKFNTII